MLIPEEIAIVNKLGQAWADFHQLSEMHPSDSADFVFHVHALQNIVMCRSAMRMHSDVFRDKTGKDAETERAELERRKAELEAKLAEAKAETDAELVRLAARTGPSVRAMDAIARPQFGVCGWCGSTDTSIQHRNSHH